MKQTFIDYMTEQDETLDLYTKAIAKVHGNNHPELSEVRELFVNIQDKVKAAQGQELELNEEFTRLREITREYETPADGCDTYKAAYQMLSQADKIYYS